MDSQRRQPNCVELSLLCARTWKRATGDQVRIACQNIAPGKDHFQAEALIGSAWVQLTEVWLEDHLEVIIYQRHYPDIQPYRYLTMREWADEQL